MPQAFFACMGRSFSEFLVRLKNELLGFAAKSLEAQLKSFLFLWDL